MTTYDPRTIEVVRCFVDGFWNDLPSRRLDYSAPDVDLWLDDAEERGLLSREPSVLSAIDGSTVLVATPKGARAVKLHDEERAAQASKPKPLGDAELAPLIAAGPSQERLPRAEPVDLDLEAVALFLKDRTRSKAEIARMLGQHRQALAPERCPKLDLAIRAWKASELPHGSKSKDGTIEAEDPSEPEDDR
jgi:hypothetical protein